MAGSIALATLALVGETGAGDADTAAPRATAPASAPAAADQAWAELIGDTGLRSYAEQWKTNRPSPQAYAEQRLRWSVLGAEAAAKAREFYTRYPEHPKAAEARGREAEWLAAAAQMGSTNATRRLAELEAARLDEPGLSPEDRFEIKARAVRRQVMLASAGGATGKALADYEQAARALREEFPARLEPWEMLLDIAEQSGDDKARTLAREISQSTAREEIREQARRLLKSLDLVGKTISLKFVSLDQREVDLGRWRGRVVLLVFWATWCGPYVTGLAEDLAVYERWHEKGFEVAGINFDLDEAAAARFVGERQIPWPQRFDGQGRRGVEFEVRRLPALWLIDKTGVVRDRHARQDLEKKIEKLLAETP